MDVVTTGRRESTVDAPRRTRCSCDPALWKHRRCRQLFSSSQTFPPEGHGPFKRRLVCSRRKRGENRGYFVAIRVVASFFQLGGGRAFPRGHVDGKQGLSPECSGCPCPLGDAGATCTPVAFADSSDRLQSRVGAWPPRAYTLHSLLPPSLPGLTGFPQLFCFVLFLISDLCRLC